MCFLTLFIPPPRPRYVLHSPTALVAGMRDDQHRRDIDQAMGRRRHELAPAVLRPRIRHVSGACDAGLLDLYQGASASGAPRPGRNLRRQRLGHSRACGVFALDAATGKELWRAGLGGLTQATPISFALNGRQVMAVAAGRTLFIFGL